jgi:hypothetical protein
VSDLHLLLSEAGVRIPSELELQYAVVRDGGVLDVYRGQAEALSLAVHVSGQHPDADVSVVPLLQFEPTVVTGDPQFIV